MERIKKIKFLYIFIAIMALSISVIGATYAYWVASTSSASNAIYTQSTIYSISMDISPLYHGFSIIPMNDGDALKALKNECRDKHDRGACSAYTIDVYDYNTELGFISGVMDITTNNMQNLSYMMLRISDVYEESQCAVIENETYCIAKEATHMGDGIGLSLGDAYDITGTESTKFILLIWLSNLNESQNNYDVGSFEAVVTMQAGNGGQIKGSISSVIILDPEVDNEDRVDDNQNETEDGA